MAFRDPPVSITQLSPLDAEAFRALRLQALASAPEAFGSSHEEEAAYPLERFRAFLPAEGPNATFGAFAGDLLVGIAGFVAQPKHKERHKGFLWGVFVRPQFRSRGIGEHLVRRVIMHAAEHVLLLQTSVVISNDAAREIYYRLGFVPYGTERKALCIDGTYYDEELLVLELRQGLAAPKV